MRYDSTVPEDATPPPKKKRGKTARSRQKRDALELLKRRRAFLQKRAAEHLSNGESAHLETRDIAAIDVATTVLSGAPDAAPPVEACKRAMTVLSRRHELLTVIVEKKEADGSDASHERREITALTFTIDELARSLAQRT